ncbi:MAG: hypothetical protein VYA30_16345 [Myxococcota bacterium]|nr:hypothetical protein [Myxococcota bacterium]
MTCSDDRLCGFGLHPMAYIICGLSILTETSTATTAAGRGDVLDTEPWLRAFSKRATDPC